MNEIGDHKVKNGKMSRKGMALLMQEIIKKNYLFGMKMNTQQNKLMKVIRILKNF